MDFFTRLWLRFAPSVFTAGEGTVVLVVALSFVWFTAEAESGAEIPAEALSRAVERELRADPVLQDADLYAISRAGRVTLGGTVDRLLWQRRAERVAETVRGVRAVVNRITIRSPTHVPDHELTERVQRILTTSPELQAADIVAETQTGGVRLTGVAASFALREWADDLVASLIGVREVDNEITVAPGPAMTGAALVSAVRRALTFDALLADDRIEVLAVGSKVRLAGEVRSAAERRRARLRAGMAGAADVDVSRLVVAHDRPHSRSRSMPQPDEAIAEAVSAALAAEPQLRARTLAVQVKKGRVELGGTLPTLLERRLATRVPRQVRGVRQVRDGITTPAPDTDARAIEMRAREALRSDPLVGDQQVAVSVRERVAVLTGTPATPWQRHHAEAVVAAVPGISAIRNELRSEQRAPYFSEKPYVGAPHFTAGGWRTLPGKARTVEDEALAEAVRAQLQWSALLEFAEVHVSVNRGVATLTGNVQTHFQATMATQEAYEGGAQLVKNLLGIRSE